MSSKLSIYQLAKTDQTAEVNGKWFTDFFEPGSGIDFKLRRLKTKPVVKVMNRVMAENRKHMVKGEYPEAIDEAMLIETFAEAVIADWRGVSDGENDIPYSKEAAMKLLTELPDLKDTINRIASQGASFRADLEADVEKN